MRDGRLRLTRIVGALVMVVLLAACTAPAMGHGGDVNALGADWTISLATVNPSNTDQVGLAGTYTTAERFRVQLTYDVQVAKGPVMTTNRIYLEQLDLFGNWNYWDDLGYLSTSFDDADSASTLYYTDTVPVLPAATYRLVAETVTCAYADGSPCAVSATTRIAARHLMNVRAA